MSTRGKRKHWTHQQGIAHRMSTKYDGVTSVVYVVFRGRTPGIYSTWEKTAQQVQGFEGASWRKFTSDGDAQKAFEDYFWKLAKRTKRSDAHERASVYLRPLAIN